MNTINDEKYHQFEQDNIEVLRTYLDHIQSTIDSVDSWLLCVSASIIRLVYEEFHKLSDDDEDDKEVEIGREQAAAIILKVMSCVAADFYIATLGSSCAHQLDS